MDLSQTIAVSSPTPLPDSSEHRTPLLRRCYWFALLSWCAIPLSPNAVDSDFWGHVQYGRDLLQHGLPRTATYTYSAIGHRWINHELWSEVLFAYVCDHWGSASLMVGKSLLGLAVLIGMLAVARRARCGWLSASMVIVTVSVNLSYYWATRPQVNSFLLFAALMALLTYAFRDWPISYFGSRASDAPKLIGPSRMVSPRHAWNCLLVCPVIMAVWANTHGGFVAGLAILLTYLGVRTAEWLVRFGWRDWQVPAWLVSVGLLSAVATVANPYGIELHTWLMYSLGTPRPEILEWHAPQWWSVDALPLWALVVLTLGGLIGSRRPRDAAVLAVLALLAWQTCSHRRHLPFLAIAVGYGCIPHIDSALRRFRPSLPVVPQTSESADSARGAVGYSLAAALALFLVGLVWTCQWLERVQEMRVARSRFPVSAFDYMARHEFQGKLFASGKWGQYALATFGARRPGDPGLQVGFDGRFRTCYPQSVVDRHFDFTVGPGTPDQRHRSATSPPPDRMHALEAERPDLVLVDRREPYAVQTMCELASRDWTLLYQDQLAQLWGRRSRYDDPQSPHHIPESEREIGNDPQSGWVAWPALPAHRPRYVLSPASPSPTG